MFWRAQYDQIKNYELYNQRFPIEKRSNSSGRGVAEHKIKKQTLSQGFNKDGIQRLGNLWEYTDEKAFVARQLLFRKAEQQFNKTEISPKLFSNRGVMLNDVYFW